MTSRRVRAFKRWMKSNCINFSDALRFPDDPDSGISVVSLCRLTVGDLIATIPKLSCLTVKTSAASQMIEEAGLEGSLALSFALMYERSLGSESLWDGYLQLLPEREPIPLVWTSEEVDSLLCGTELHKVLGEDMAYLYEDWKEYIQPLIVSGSFKLDPSYFGVEQYFSAKSLVSSRSFQIDDYHGSGMVPLVDLFNHKTNAENVHFTASNSLSSSDSEEDGNMGAASDNESLLETFSSSSLGDNHTNSGDDPNTLEVIVVSNVEAGAEVFNTYGCMGNAALLHRYGFTELDNTLDIVNIDVNLVLEWCSLSFSNRYARSRLTLWRRLNFSGCTGQDSEYFEISFNGEPQTELVVLLHIIFLPEDICQKLSCMIDCFSEADHTTNLVKLTNISRSNFCGSKDNNIMELLLAQDVCDALISLVDMREREYGSISLEEEKNELERCCPVKDRKLYHSLMLRVKERNVLSRLRAFASRLHKGKKREILKGCSQRS